MLLWLTLGTFTVASAGQFYSSRRERVTSKKFKSLITAATDLKEFQRFEQTPFVRKETCSEIALLETLEFFLISHGTYQSFNFLPYLSLSTHYSLISLIGLRVPGLTLQSVSVFFHFTLPISRHFYCSQCHAILFIKRGRFGPERIKNTSLNSSICIRVFNSALTYARQFYSGQCQTISLYEGRLLGSVNPDHCTCVPLSL